MYKRQVGNRGLYNDGQITEGGEEPSDNLMVYKISPGKAYVRGYEVEFNRATNMDVDKPRSVKVAKNQSINFGFGPSFELNNVTGSPTLGFNNSNTISLRSERVGSEKRPSSTHTAGPATGTNRVVDAGHVGAAGSEIGVARLYDFALESGSYNTQNPAPNQWDISLWDVQMYTSFVLNEPITLPIPTYIKGQSSGATGFLRTATSNSTQFTAYDVKGTFFPGERLSFDGVNDNDRFVVDIHNYEISDIGSLYGSVGVATFTGDLIPKRILGFGNGTVSGSAASSTGQAGVSTVTSAGDTFAGIVTTGDLIRYKRPGFTLPTINKVTGVFDTSLSVVGVSTVTGVFDGGVPNGTASNPSGSENVSNLQLVGTEIQLSLIHI